MEKERYIISDAAQMIHVESHVLRYWEEELDLKVPRNELGHRYYTKENMEQFQKIKDLKEKGYQLKAIKMLIHGEAPLDIPNEEEKNVKKEVANVPQKMNTGIKVSQLGPEEKMEQFQRLMTGIVKQAIEENNQALGISVGEQVGEQVLKEMNYLMREQEELAEEHYRKLDEAIRQHYKSKKIFGKSKEKSLQPKTI
ncbi:MAG: helix-turn-helix domain-containing protein [Lachnospiraceae bacterium]|nr:helix-turn-helix domain-containing protein [Lachnospiraceae bacterium]MDD7378034.1 helix-turn-helix domain-containing protein [Lachnospiraceae bacterium]MDY4617016.1 helix-turn-helix domain-containing protein [Lachnospiraceae bacterium]MDY5774945.1 helix-turn-helix domain-containing protein [Lachnospiraceae bacterium]